MTLKIQLKFAFGPASFVMASYFDAKETHTFRILKVAFRLIILWIENWGSVNRSKIIKRYYCVIVLQYSLELYNFYSFSETF